MGRQVASSSPLSSRKVWRGLGRARLEPWVRTLEAVLAVDGQTRLFGPCRLRFSLVTYKGPPGLEGADTPRALLTSPTPFPCFLGLAPPPEVLLISVNGPRLSLPSQKPPNFPPSCLRTLPQTVLCHQCPCPKPCPVRPPLS